MLAKNSLCYVQPDHLGTSRAVIEPVRDVAIWKWDLKGEAFGNTPPDQDPDKDGTAFVFDMRFPGQRYDSATGFNQNYFRDYDPGTGRYGQSDPVGLAGGISTYAYAEGNPVSFVDPFGLQPGDCYPMKDIAGANAINDINYTSIRVGAEYAGRIYRNPNGTFSYTTPRRGSMAGSNPGPIGPNNVGDYHTHGANDPGYDNENFSNPGDIPGITADNALSPGGNIGYLGTPRGIIKKYDPNSGRVSVLPYPSPNNGDACGCQ